MRTCFSCKRKGEKEEFLRFVEFEGKPLFDPTGKLPGRGYNICPTRKCLKTFLKKKFKGKISEDEFLKNVTSSLRSYLLNLLSLCHKTGITVIGQDNVKSFFQREGTLFLSSDLSEKTKKRLEKCATLVVEDLFTSSEIGNALKKETTIGVVFVEKAGLGKKLYNIAQKLLSLESKS